MEDQGPFWSEGVAADVRLQQMRPRDLAPVPDGSLLGVPDVAHYLELEKG